MREKKLEELLLTMECYRVLSKLWHVAECDKNDEE